MRAPYTWTRQSTIFPNLCRRWRPRYPFIRASKWYPNSNLGNGSMPGAGNWRFQSREWGVGRFHDRYFLSICLTLTTSRSSDGFRFLLRGSPLRPLFPSQQQQRGQAALRPCCWCALRAFAYWCGRLPAAVSCWPVPAFAHLAAETDGVSLLTILGLPLRNINLLAISYDAYNRNPQSTQNPSVGGSVRSLMKGPQ